MTSPAEGWGRVAARVGETVVGQDDALRLAFVTLLCSGHSLIEGVPGVAKTLLVRTLARAVELRFVDEGHGMDEEAVKRAADPFFTTKQTGDRMGLGLFLARTLVDSLSGELSIDSVQSHGTTIRVVLPQRA